VGEHDEDLTRRELLRRGAGLLGAGLAAGAAAGCGEPRSVVEPLRDGLIPGLAAREAALTGGDTRVAVVGCDAYRAAALDEALERGAALAPPPEVQGRRVVLKPNFVEFHRDRPVTTHVEVIRALVRLFRARGAREVVVAEGPGHRRDTTAVWGRAGLAAAAREDDFRLVDLNFDDPAPVPMAVLPPGSTRGPSLIQTMFLPRTIREAEVLVSVPKLKTHHWAGCTLGMKNLFGVVPGVKYGWPKNILHFNQVIRTVVELAANVPVAYTVVDGVEGMEGDGPIMGSAVPAQALVMGRSRTGVDVTAARLMGLRPDRLEFLELAAAAGFPVPWEPQVLGEGWKGLRREFQVLESWEYLRG
jgi:uncharacterized protein (DUF362 family)